MKICVTNILQHLQLQEHDRQYFMFKIKDKIKICGKEQGLRFFLSSTCMHTFLFLKMFAVDLLLTPENQVRI